MKLRKILLAVAGLALMLNASAQKSKRYYVAKPGTLVELMTEAEANEITQLTLQGKLNAVDFRHLRDEFKNLQLLDISNASISMYAGKNGTYPNRFYVYPANCIPAYAFCKQMDIPSIANLEKVVIKAVDKILDNQNVDGGWAYNYNTKAGAHTDLSVTGWNVQALKAAEHGGIKPSRGEIRAALRKAAIRLSQATMTSMEFYLKMPVREFLELNNEVAEELERARRKK